MKTGYFWPVYGDQDEVAFPFASSRAKKEAEEILGEYCGTLLTDGYTAYERWAEKRKEVTHALCWSHTRRGFVKAEDLEPVRSAEAIRRIRELYVIEKEIRAKKLDGEAKQAEQGLRSKPLVAAFFEWLKTEMAESALIPTNPFTKAALYALDREKGLEVFLSDPDGEKELDVLLDGGRGREGGLGADADRDVPHPRHRSLHVSRRRAAAGRLPSAVSG